MNIVQQMIILSNDPVYLSPSTCCPQKTMQEAFTWWPLQKEDNGAIPEETFDLALKWFQTRFKLQGFNFKVSKKTKCLTLLQIIFTHGVKSQIFKAKDETEDNMQNVLLKDC